MEVNVKHSSMNPSQLLIFLILRSLLSRCEMCVYHAAGEVRKLAARRGTFSQSILIPKKNDISNSPHLLHKVK